MGDGNLSLCRYTMSRFTDGSYHKSYEKYRWGIIKTREMDLVKGGRGCNGSHRCRLPWGKVLPKSTKERVEIWVGWEWKT